MKRFLFAPKDDHTSLIQDIVIQKYYFIFSPRVQRGVPAVRILLERRSRSYRIDDFEICESKAQNRDVRPWLTSVAQQAHPFAPVDGIQPQIFNLLKT